MATKPQRKGRTYSLPRRSVSAKAASRRPAARRNPSAPATASSARSGRRTGPHRRAPGNIIDVAAGLIFRGGKLLITKRFPDAHLGGLWEFPGGKLEPNETFQQCLVRELDEELGIQVTVGPLVQAVTHDYRDKHVHLKFFRCQWKANEPRPLGCEACQWVTREELRHFQFPEADAVLLRKLQRDQRLWQTL